MPETSYEYTKLPPLHIRLIRLQPCLNSEGPLQFSFLTSSLDDVRGEYDAISYTWGSIDLTHGIPCIQSDGGAGGAQYVLRITENLSKVLTRFRHRLDERVLWTDALCIDQTNNEEKSSQTPMMDKIYRGVRRVVGWLGDGLEGMGTTLHALGRLSEFPRGRIDNEAMTSISSALPQFVSLPWFRRLWIVQEAVLNIDLTLVCGHSELSITKFVTGVDALQATPCWKPVENLPGAVAVLFIITIWKQYRNNAEIADLGIIELIEQASYHGCGDARDRIFALYSMASDIYNTATEAELSTTAMYPQVAPDPISSEVICLAIDYDADTQEIYTRFALASFRSAANWSVLISVLERAHVATDTDWPSWVPDWRVSPKQLTGVPRQFNKKSRQKQTFMVLLAHEENNKIRVLSRAGVGTIENEHVSRSGMSLHELSKWSKQVSYRIRHHVGRLHYADNKYKIANEVFVDLVLELCEAEDLDPNSVPDLTGPMNLRENLDIFKAGPTLAKRRRDRRLLLEYMGGIQSETSSAKAHVDATGLIKLISALSSLCFFFVCFPLEHRAPHMGFDEWICTIGCTSLELKEGDKLMRIPSGGVSNRTFKIQHAIILRPMPGPSSSYRIIGDAQLSQCSWTRVGVRKDMVRHDHAPRQNTKQQWKPEEITIQ